MDQNVDECKRVWRAYAVASTEFYSVEPGARARTRHALERAVAVVLDGRQRLTAINEFPKTPSPSPVPPPLRKTGRCHFGRNLKSEIAISSFPWIRNPNLPWVKSRPGSAKVSSTFHSSPTSTLCTRRSGVTSICMVKAF
jgi:hypothetical protein